MNSNDLAAVNDQIEYLQKQTVSGVDLKSIVWDCLQEMENLTNLIMESGIDPTPMKEEMRSFLNSH